MKVHFFLPGEKDIDALRRISPDGKEEIFRRGEMVWILRTFAYLRDSGLEVELVGEVPHDAGALVFHTKHRRLVARSRRIGGTVLVSVRADGRESAAADLEVLQNGHFADGRRRFSIPHWPQPGLRPRDPARGTVIETVAYRGLSRHLEAGFCSDEWVQWLADRDIDWVETGQDWADRAIDRLRLDWHDYRTVDVALAVRPPDPRCHTSKPASKLVNAWVAGCPAILGPEVAFRELRRSPLDYIEVADVAEAKAAIDQLRGNPDLYRAMVDNGFRRAEEFTPAVITDLWRRLLSEELPRVAADNRLGRKFVFLRPAVWVSRAAGRILAGRPTR